MASQGYDYIVIGAGAAGSIVAGQAAAAGNAVLLLDMGLGVDPGENDVWDPTRWYEVLANTAYEIGWKSQPQAQLDNRVINLLQSRGLGGCQLHNAMVYVRGGAATYDGWASTLGCTGWDWNSLLPSFALAETVGITQGESDDFTESFFAAAGRLGLPFNPDYNDGNAYGAVPFQFTIANAGGNLQRTTSYETFVRQPAYANLDVEPGCFVHRVIPGTPPSVEYRDRFGNVQTVTANKEVILSAGAIGSPAILLRSGIGPADALTKAGVAVVCDLPGVGANFYDDLGVGMIVTPSVPLPVSPYGYYAAGAFASSQGSASGPIDIEVQISTNALAGAPPLPKPLPDVPYLIVGASALHLKSRGTVSIRSANPYDPPIVDPNWLSDPDDMAHCLAALGLVYEFAADPTFAATWGWTPPPPLPPVKFFPLYPIDGGMAWIRMTGLTVQHYVGSCAMGVGSDAVTDPATLKVLGVDGIRVIDASVAPTPVTGNTAGVSMVIGAKGAQLLLG